VQYADQYLPAGPDAAPGDVPGGGPAAGEPPR
jgi:hypothetical protein